MAGNHREEIEHLFLHYGKGVGSFVMARVADPELAEEITARVFLTVVRQFSQLRGSVTGWLWAIVRNELNRHFRDRRAHAPLNGELTDGAELPSDRLARLQVQERLQAALGQLPTDLQQIVYMKFFLDLPNLEIAQATGLTPSHIGVKIHRTLKELRELMDGPTRGRTEHFEEHES